MNRLCPVCRQDGQKPCLGLDFLPLPTEHGERSVGTPLFDELLAEVAS